jgi:hypothetical protein
MDMLLGCERKTIAYLLCVTHAETVHVRQTQAPTRRSDPRRIARHHFRGMLQTLPGVAMFLWGSDDHSHDSYTSSMVLMWRRSSWPSVRFRGSCCVLP